MKFISLALLHTLFSLNSFANINICDFKIIKGLPLEIQDKCKNISNDDLLSVKKISVLAMATSKEVFNELSYFQNVEALNINSILNAGGINSVYKVTRSNLKPLKNLKELCFGCGLQLNSYVSFEEDAFVDLKGIKTFELFGINTNQSLYRALSQLNYNTVENILLNRTHLIGNEMNLINQDKNKLSIDIVLSKFINIRSLNLNLLFEQINPQNKMNYCFLNNLKKLNHLELNNMDSKNNDLKQSITMGCLTNLESLKRLNIGDVLLENIENEQFINLKNLESLEIHSHADSLNVKDFAFKGLEKLKSLFISSNPGGHKGNLSINSSALGELFNLKTLKLYDQTEDEWKKISKIFCPVQSSKIKIEEIMNYKIEDFCKKFYQ